VIPHVGEVVRGEDCYLAPSQFPEKGYRRKWSWRGGLRSAEFREGGIAKNWGSFSGHDTPDSMRFLLEESAARGVERPSGYGDLFHQTCRFAPVRAAVRKMFPGGVPGAWQQAIESGAIHEPLYQYDIRSAYLWSLSQGLPDPDTFVDTKKIIGPGLYWVDSPAQPLLPYPWNTVGRFPATEEEILAFPINPRSVSRGIAFAPNTQAIGQAVESIKAWSCWKAVGRSFWGRWASIGKVECTTYDADDKLRTSREMADATRNPVWGAIITSRVRMRLYEMTWKMPVSRVYVDSVVTRQQIDVGDGVGEWKLVDYFPDGAVVTVNGVRNHSRVTLASLGDKSYFQA
jgi:hypothetical protein